MTSQASKWSQAYHDTAIGLSIGSGSGEGVHPSNRAEVLSSGPSAPRLIRENAYRGPDVTTDVPLKDYVDRSMESVRAQNDARFAEVLGEIRGLRQDISGKPSTWQMVGAVFAGAATILGVILAALSYGGDRFDGGIGMADQRQEQMQRDAEQDAIIKRLDALIAAQATPPAPAPGTPSD